MEFERMKKQFSDTTYFSVENIKNEIMKTKTMNQMKKN